VGAVRLGFVAPGFSPARFSPRARGQRLARDAFARVAQGLWPCGFCAALLADGIMADGFGNVRGAHELRGTVLGTSVMARRCH